MPKFEDREAFVGIIAANAHKEGNQLYNVPYDWHVDLPSYITYVEPALGALVAALAMRRVQVKPSYVAIVIFALQAGPLFRLGLNMLYAKSNWISALLSEGQFTLEALALAWLVTVTAYVAPLPRSSVRRRLRATCLLQERSEEG